MKQRLEHLETAFREFVEHESEHVAELQRQLSDVREGGAALRGPLSAVAEEQAGRLSGVEERLDEMGAQLGALQRLFRASIGTGQTVAVGVISASEGQRSDYGRGTGRDDDDSSRVKIT